MSEKQRVYKYYDLIMAVFVTILLCSNLIGVSKLVTICGLTFGGGMMFPKKVDKANLMLLLPFCPPQILLG